MGLQGVRDNTFPLKHVAAKNNKLNVYSRRRHDLRCGDHDKDHSQREKDEQEARAD